MATKRNGTVTVAREFARHLRKYGKRMFWKAERREARRLANRQDN